MKYPFKRGKGVAALGVAVILGLGASSAVDAESLSFQFNTSFYGDAPTSTNQPWMTALFQDVSPGTVRLTVSNVNLVAWESVDQIYFNLDPSLNPQSLRFTSAGGSGSFDQPVFSTGINKLQATGDGKYDLLLNLTHKGKDQNQFGAGESFSYLISGIPSLDAADFNFLSSPAGGAGPFFAAAHVERIGPCQLDGSIAANTTSIVLVPEPSAGSLGALALSLWLGVHLWRRCVPAAKVTQLKPAPIRRERNNRRRI